MNRIKHVVAFMIVAIAVLLPAATLIRGIYVLSWGVPVDEPSLMFFVDIFCAFAVITDAMLAMAAVMVAVVSFFVRVLAWAVDNLDRN